MTLSALIRKRETGNRATAIPAISATQQKEAAGTVARIATVAVATAPEAQTANPVHKVGAGDTAPTSVAALRRAANDAAPDPARAHRRWSIQFSGLRVGEAIFHADVTRAEAIAAFPGSMTATPLPETPLRPPTQAEREELIELIDTALPGDPEGQHEALTIALADVDNAIVCFRRLAVERHERS